MTGAVSIKDLHHLAQRPRLLAHICCGPCAVAPLRELLKDTAEVWGFFHNPNIHPLEEFRKRLDAVKTLSALLSIPIIYDENYRPREFIKGVRSHTGKSEGVPPFGERCGYCYSSRLEATAKAAKQGGFGLFTSTLLFSRYQEHEAIRAAGVEFARKYGILFLYEDFRLLWQDGRDASRALGLYSQKYCGCMYSRIERNAQKKRKKGGG